MEKAYHLSNERERAGALALRKEITAISLSCKGEREGGRVRMRSGGTRNIVTS